MSPYVWMFISSYEKLRRSFIEQKTITTLAQLEYSAFADATVPLCVFTLKNIYERNKGVYFRLTEFTGGMEVQDRKILEAINDHDCGYYFEVSAEQFEKIPGSPIGYWIPDKIYQNYFTERLTMGSISEARMGLTTGQNEKYIRLWHEVKHNKIGFHQDRNKAQESGLIWFPYDKGGEYRKWYGNREYIVNWFNDGYEMQHILHPDGKRIWAHNFNLEYNFLPHITWTDLTSGHLAFRVFEEGFLFDSSAAVAFTDYPFESLIGYLNTNLVDIISDILNPTMHFKLGDYDNIPFPAIKSEPGNYISQYNISISKLDWDSFESSWDFSIHPLLDENVGKSEDAAFEKDSELIDYLGEDKYNEIFNNEIKACAPIEFAYLRYKDWANKAFFHLKKNEEELNRIFIDIYGLNDELKPEEDDSMVSVHRIFDDKSEIPESMRKGQYALTREDVVKAFISYVVGCMFGRYDADRPGLAYAGGDFDISTYSGEHGLVPDSDNVIPILGDSWFKNDAETYFIKFVENQFGHEKLNENLKFIENALGKSIRDYFYKDFYKNHLKTYQKRPIYWMFSSPKGYFQALVYMHRYNENTANAVLDCLRQFRDKIRLQIKLAEEAGQTRKKVEYENIDNDLNAYEMNILYPLAIQHLTFDLDDGVKVNYEKLGKALKAIK